MANHQDNTGKNLSVQSVTWEPVLLAVAVLILTVLTDSYTPAFLGTGLMLYAIVYGVFTVAGRRRVSQVVRMYHDNLFYINARDFMWFALRISLLMTVVPVFVLLFFGGGLATLLTGNVKTRLVLYMLALLFPLTAAEGVTAGFNEGMRRQKSAALADLIYALLAGVLTVLFGLFGHRYGIKMDALLYTTDCAGAYAALFAMAGLAVASILRLLMLVLTAGRVLKKLSPLHETGKPKFVGEKSPYLKAIWQLMLTTALPTLLTVASSCALSRHEEQNTLLLLGLFYGHYLPYIVIFGFLGARVGIRIATVLFHKTQMGEGEIPKWGEKLSLLIHRESLICFPIGTFLMALAPCLEGGLFLLKNETAEGLLTLGGFTAALMSMGITLTTVLVLLKSMFPLIGCALAGAIMALPCVFLTGAMGERAVYGMLTGTLVFDSVFILSAVAILRHILSIKKTPLFTLMIKPFIASAVTALVISPVVRGLKYLIGEIPAGVICAVAGSVMYLILLSVVRGIEPDELKSIPGGILLEKISLRARKN